MTGIIYKYTNTLNGKSYIGMTIRELKVRKAEGYTAKFANALKKYGWDVFDTEILGEYPVEQLSEMEKCWIAEHDSFNNGYNSTLGGEGFGQRPWTEEQKKHLSKKQKGEKNSFYGKEHTPEMKTYLGEILRKNFNKEAVIAACKARSKSIQQLTKDGEMITEYKSLKEAAKAVNGSAGNISMVANGKWKTAYGYKWQWTVGF